MQLRSGRDHSNNEAAATMNDLSSISLAQGADSSIFANMRGLLQTVTPYGEQHVINDQDEHTVVRYGTQCSFRGRVVSFVLIVKDWVLLIIFCFDCRADLCVEYL